MNTAQLSLLASVLRDSQKDPDRLREILRNSGLPSTQNEDYRYTPLLERMVSYYTSREAVSAEVFRTGRIPQGIYLTEAMEDLPKGLSVRRIRWAERDKEGEGATPWVMRDAFARLNTVLCEKVWEITLEKGLRLDSPLVLTSAMKRAEEAGMHVIIRLEEGSEMSIIQVEEDFEGCFENGVLQVFCGAHSRAKLVKLQSFSGTLVDHTYIHQQTQSEITCYTLSRGAGMVRNNLHAYLCGKEAKNFLRGVLIGKGQGHLDHHTRVSHEVMDTHSYQNYRSCMSGDSQGVFRGAIHMAEGAIHTTAYQSSKALLLDSGSSMYAKPQLEIFADDVRCSHGCTVGPMDWLTLFYLQSRVCPGIRQGR